MADRSEHELFDLVLDGLDLAGQFSGFVGSDGCCNDRAGDTTGASQRRLGRNEDIGYVLVLAEKGQMHEDFDWLRVCGENNEFCDTAVQCLSGFVGALLQLLIVLGLLNEIEDLAGEIFRGKWPGFGRGCVVGH